MLGGAAAGGLIAGRTVPARMMFVFALTGAAADLDLLFGVHSGPTHGVGFALIAGAIAWLVCSSLPRSSGRLRVAIAAAAAYASHPLLDWLSTDTSAPIGIMALWPLTTDYYLSPFRIFLPLLRRYSPPEFWLLNLRAVIRELLILGPLLWIVWWVRREHRQPGVRLFD
jgi:inner membrane protein